MSTHDDIDTNLSDNLSLDDIARTNLTKINDRWGETAGGRRPAGAGPHE